MVLKKNFFCFVLLTFLSGIVLAGTTGKLVGTVVDKSNREPLAGVNVVIATLGMGTASDTDGYFFINNVPPGNYTVEFTYIGYQAVEYQNIAVTVDHTTEISLEMQAQAIEGEVVTVVAERPLILKDETSQRAVIQGEQIIDKLPVSTLQDVLSLQAGVTRDENGSIHIRGGRLDEVAYLIDGTYVRNPFDNSLGGNVDVQAIQEMEVISGTFNAEYGNALSGVVNIVTREGTPEFNFRMQYESPMLNQSPYHRQDWLLQTDVVKGLSAEEQEAFRDEVRDNTTGESAYSRFRALDHPFTNDLKGISMLGRLNASVSGPFPVFKDKVQFLLAGTFRNEENPLPYGFDLERIISGKLTFKLSPTIKLQFGGDWSRLWYQDYNHQYKYWQFFEASNPQVGSFPVSQDLRTRFTGKFTHTLSGATYYNLSLSRVYNYEEEIVPDRTVVTDPQTGALISSDYITRGYYAGVDGSFQTGDVRYWLKTKSTTYDVDFDIISQVNRYNQVKSGLEFRRHEIFRHRVGMPPRSNVQFFTREPLEFAAYMQDKIEFSFLIVNLGLRFDYYDPRDQYYPDPGNILRTETDAGGTTVITTVPKEKVGARKKFSPRIGLAHPISSRTVFHFAYGQFFQIPRYYDLYRNNDLEDILVNDALIGNPGLLPEETTAFEAGIKQQIGDDYAVNLSAYYKDINNLISSFYYFSGRDYTIFINADYGRVQGLDISLTKRYSYYFSGALAYTFMNAQGNESDPLEGYNQYREDDAHLRPNRNFPLDFDRRHNVSANVDVVLPRDLGPRVFGGHIFGNFSMNFLFRAASGLPYTPTSRDPDATIVPEKNSARKPWTNQFDMRLNKRINLFKGSFADLYLRVENLFDNINVLRVWTSTGDPWNQGPTSNYSKDRQANPESVDIRRTVRMGLILRF